MPNPRSWDRRLWGVKFQSARDSDRPILLGRGWDLARDRINMSGEPTRPLLFVTRHEAREWCRATRKSYEGRSDCCADWRFTAVRVRERVEVVDA